MIESHLVFPAHTGNRGSYDLVVSSDNQRFLDLIRAEHALGQTTRPKDRRCLEDFLDIEAVLHQEIQPVIYKDLRQDHPITQGIEPFFVNLEEQFGVKIKTPSKTTILFRSLAVHDKRDSIAGWCLERGKGRIVGLLPGHLEWPYRVPEYREIFWRSAFWAMGRDIEPYTKG